MRALMQLAVTLGLLGSVWAGLGLVAWSAGALPELVGAGSEPVNADPSSSAPSSSSPNSDSPNSDSPNPESPNSEPSTRSGFDPHANDSSGHARAVPSEAIGSEGRPDPSSGPAPGVSPSGALPSNEATTPPSASQTPSTGPSDPASEHLPTRTFALDPPEGHHHVTSLVAADLFGDETPELVVGLGNRFEVFRIQGEGELERVAIVRLTPADPSNVVSSPRAAVGDVTGDGLPDLVVSFWQRASSLGSRGGGAWLLRGKPDGTLDRPRQFCGPRVAASSLALLDLDGRGGLDVVVADRGRPYGNINGRVFLYAGGRMPRLLRELRTEVKDVRFVLPAHANDDDLIDLVVVGETTVRYQNEGRGRFEPMGDVQPGILFADVPHGYSGDLDGDGRLEAYVLTNSEGGGTLIVEPSGTRFWGNFGRGDRDALHHAVVAVRDVDGDGRAEALMLQSYGTWGIGFFSAEGATERLVASRAFGGPGPDGQDGALLARADGSVERVTLDSLYHSDTRENSWQLTRTSVCTECDGVDVQAGSVRSASGASEWTVR